VNRPLSPPKIEFPSGVTLMASRIGMLRAFFLPVERGLIFGINPVTLPSLALPMYMPLSKPPRPLVDCVSLT
jgi:hypothetical protein